ncbi:hypothetical protein FHT77_000459 [Rhizobium sp. BK181]|uniref:hypothetical protein n=1 Tax=Rhizobium sp. BK181 TaxID=2587072 RepID=UPI00161D5E30|nr:hypothetical protein [Rhizobium sp. BK181]MBB3314617.1 hypothetical protein [Rhizobium sp. BK181]
MSQFCAGWVIGLVVFDSYDRQRLRCLGRSSQRGHRAVGLQSSCAISEDAEELFVLPGAQRLEWRKLQHRERRQQRFVALG